VQRTVFKGPPEKRVRVKNLGILTKTDPRAVLLDAKLRGGGRQWLHWRAATKLAQLLQAAWSVTPDLRAVSCLRDPKKDTKEEWIAKIKAFDITPSARAPNGPRKYWKVTDQTEDQSRKRLFRFRAYNSGHETGLSVDFASRSEGLGTNSKRIHFYRGTQVYAWLASNAINYGFTPYNNEPWHWELFLTRKEWLELPDGGFVMPDAYAARATGFSSVTRYDAYQSAKDPLAADVPLDKKIVYKIDHVRSIGKLFDFDLNVWR